MELLTAVRISAWQQIQYVFKCKKNIVELREGIRDLEYQRKEVQLLVDEAIRNAHDIGIEIVEWLEKVNNIMREGNEILEHTANARCGQLCFMLPKPYSSYKLSKQAYRIIAKVFELEIAGNFTLLPTPPMRMPVTSHQESVGFVSRVRIRNLVMEALNDDSITLVGICGVGGIGKTTLVKKIAQRVRSGCLFPKVIMVPVYRHPDVVRIQVEIGEMLGVRIDEMTASGRAEQLRLRLMCENIVIILDDVWEKLDLLNIGIPIKHPGIKVLLTSRDRHVLHEMHAKTFEVYGLSQEESWSLFKENADISEDNTTNLIIVAKEVAERCGGLPLAIVTVSRALKGKPLSEWRSALLQLQKGVITSIPGVDILFHPQLEKKIDALGKDPRSVLLLCSLFPENFDIPLEDLVRYAVGCQFFGNVETVAQATKEVQSITEVLKSHYLLLAGDGDCVKLGDNVRDVCLSGTIFSDRNLFVRHHAGLNEWFQEVSTPFYNFISLTFNKLDRLPSGLEYPELKLLKLVLPSHSLHIPEDFFSGMKDLKVLDFKNFNGKLPSSFRLLENLQTLCLVNCRLDGDISVIGSLRKIEILSFYSSHIEQFPNEIMQLSNMKSLDLRFEIGPPLPSRILSSFVNLEELHLGYLFEELDNKGEEAQSATTALRNSLLNLRTLQFTACDDYSLEHVLENLDPATLVRFNITRANDDEAARDSQYRKALTLHSANIDLLLKPSVQCFLWGSEDLTIRAKGLTNFVNELDGKGFSNLQKLNLDSCDLKYLVDSTNFLTSDGIFSKLEQLIIENANNLEEICHGNLPGKSFARLQEIRLYKVPALRHLWAAVQHPSLGSLKILDIRFCGLVQGLFLQSSLKCLHQLQQISIHRCPMLERVVSNDEKDVEDTGYVQFPRLKILQLSDLDSFMSFGPESSLGSLFQKVMLDNLETLDIVDTNGIRCVMDDQMPIGSLSKLKTILLRSCDGLLHVAASDSIRLLQCLEQLHVSFCESLEVVFDFMDLNVKRENVESPLGRLESLELWYLPNLKHICAMLPKAVRPFENLRSLKIRSCHNLRDLLSPCMAKMLMGLETLELRMCTKLEAIIGNQESVITEIESEEEIIRKKDEESTNRFELPKLQSLRLTWLENLQMVCPQNVDLDLPSLTEMVIKNCPRMTNLSVGRLSATKLQSVRIKPNDDDDDDEEEDNDNKCKEVSLDDLRKDWESKIRCLNCSLLKQERCGHLD